MDKITVAIEFSNTSTKFYICKSNPEVKAGELIMNTVNGEVKIKLDDIRGWEKESYTGKEEDNGKKTD